MPDWACYGFGVAIVAAVYRRSRRCNPPVPRLRNLATCLWLLGLAAVLVSELALIRDDVWYPVAVAMTASVLASLASRLNEQRLWLGGAALLATDGLLVLLAIAPPNRILTSTPARPQA